MTVAYVNFLNKFGNFFNIFEILQICWLYINKNAIGFYVCGFVYFFFLYKYRVLVWIKWNSEHMTFITRRSLSKWYFANQLISITHLKQKECHGLSEISTKHLRSSFNSLTRILVIFDRPWWNFAYLTNRMRWRSFRNSAFPFNTTKQNFGPSWPNFMKFGTHDL